MRNVIIAGIPRSGKTTLARKVATNFNLTHVPLDPLVKAFEKAFPQIGISNDVCSYNELCDLIRPFLFEHLLWMSRYRIPFVLDAYYLRPEDLDLLEVEGGFVAVFLGYGEISADDKLRAVRSNEREWDWTRFFPDSEIHSSLKAFIKASQNLQSSCEGSPHPYIDTGVNWNAGIDRAFRFITAALA